MEEQKVIEGDYFSVSCNFTEGNPPSTTVYWTKDDPYFRQSQQYLTITNVSRSDSGTYVCFAENTYSSGRKGTSNNTMELDVQYPPRISLPSTLKPVEGEYLTVVCNVTEGNPRPVTKISWYKSGHGFFKNGKILSFPNITRSHSGTYTCTAENTYFSGARGSDKQSITIDVEYPPRVSLFSTKYPVEYSSLYVTCSATNGNPSTTLFYWKKSGDSDFQLNDANLRLYSINRNQSGTYICTAENTYSSGSKGSDSQQLVVDVQYGPTLTGGTVTVSEGQQASMTATVTSNPPSRVSWFRGSDLLYTQGSASGVSTYTISSAQCTDTVQFRVVASNGIQNNASTTVYLYVYCSPRLNSSGSSVFISIGNNKYMDGQVTILSYPQPNYTLTLPNGAPNTNISLSISTITTNIYRIKLRKSNIQPKDHGTYKMIVSNAYGTRILDINVHPESKPLKTDQVFVSCGNRKAYITWQSSYFGYEAQNSLVQYSTKPDSVAFFNGSGLTPERIEQELLHVTVSGLQDNTKYFFRVASINRYGVSLSSVVDCTTETKNEETWTASVATGTVLGILLALSIVALAFVSYNYFQERKAKKARFVIFKSGPYDAIEKGKTEDINLYEKYTYQNRENGNPDTEWPSELSINNLYSSEPQQKDQVVERIYENTSLVKSSKDKLKPEIKPKPQKLPKPIT
ncbi:hemicentin-1-like isoform X3 [Saccostrea cucullata]|uniref:hemicentin-1-like isoform X3 n=1 Tax=Saccostrea cuccullata TaxID=36930 RepID=UPI002ED4D819